MTAISATTGSAEQHSTGRIQAVSDRPAANHTTISESR